MNQKKQRRKYDADFKGEVLEMLSNGGSARHISQKLNVGENLVIVGRSAKGSFRS